MLSNMQSGACACKRICSAHTHDMCASMLSQSEEERTLNLSANEHYYYKCAHTRHRYMTIHAHIHKTHQMKRAALVIQRHYRGMRVCACRRMTE